jgi:signal transduction histidine kinase
MVKPPAIYFLIALCCASFGVLAQQDLADSLALMESLRDFKPLYTNKISTNNIKSSSIIFGSVHVDAELGGWFDYQDFTITMWLKPGVNQGLHANIIDNNHRHLTSWVFQQYGKYSNEYMFSHGGTATPSVTLTAGIWQQVTLISTHGDFAIYLNGELVTSEKLGPIKYDGTESLRLGAWGAGGRIWNGEIGEVRIYTSALTGDQIKNLFFDEVPADSSNLIAHYKMYDLNRDVIDDASGNNHPMTLIKSPAIQQAAIELFRKDIMIKREQLKRESMLRNILIGNVVILTLIGFLIFRLRQRYLKKLKEVELQARIRIEKERIAQDLHDNIGTQLTLMVSGLSKVAKGSDSDKERLEQLHQNMNATVAELRDTIWAINKDEVTLTEMEDKINTLFWRLKQSDESVRYEFIPLIKSREHKLKPAQAVNIFRIIQEAISNCKKHSGGDQVSVKFESKENQIRLSIADNGRGFDIHSNNSDDHYGLKNMKKRSDEIGANFSIISESNSGTTVQVALALNKERLT